ncbi:MAG: hypothetical protein ACYS3S_22040 [Planctomycetota bacterium]|jgi:hypothetical protein
MRSGNRSGNPGEALCRIYINGAIGRIRAGDGTLGSETPDLALISLDAIGLIDTPVVRFG